MNNKQDPVIEETYQAIKRNQYVISVLFEAVEIAKGTIGKRLGKQNKKQVETPTSSVENEKGKSTYFNSNGLIKQCLSFPCDVNTQDKDGRTALFIFFESSEFNVISNKRCFQDLLEMKLDVNIPNYEGTYVIHLASAKGSYEQLQKLHKQKAKLDVLDKYLRTPLHIAVLCKNEAAIKFFLENTDNKDAEDVDGNTVVHYAAMKNDQFSILQVFRNLGYNMKVRNNYQKNALHYASANGEYENLFSDITELSAVKFLVNCGIRPSSQDVYACTSLMYGCKTGSLRTVAYLSEFEGTLNLQDLKGNTALHYACQRSMGKEYVSCLIKASVDINVQNNLGKTPLLIAIEEHNYKIAHTLLDHNAEVNVQDFFQRTALHYAIACNGKENCKNKCDVMKRLLKTNANVNIEDTEGITPLHLACIYRNGHEIAKLLIKHKCNINIVDKFGRHPTLLAAEHGFKKLIKYILYRMDRKHLPPEIIQPLIRKVVQKSDIGMLRYLLDYDSSILKSYPTEHIDVMPRSKTFLELLLKYFDINQKYAKNQTILHRLCISGNLDMIRHTLDIEGCDLNAKDDNGATALHLAIQYSGLKVIKLLLLKGASLDARDDNNALPIHFACRYTNKEMVEYILKKLKKTQKDLNLFDVSNRGLHHYAILNRKDDVLSMLIDCGIDILSVDETGKSVLHYVGQYQDSEHMVDLLIKHGISVNRRDKLDMTAMHYAAKYGNTSTLTALINHNGNVNVRDKQGNTPLHIAVIYNKSDTVTQLVGGKANFEATNDFGQTAVHIAAFNGQTDIIEKLLTEEYTFLGDKNQNTILHLACQRSHVDIVNYLVRKYHTRNIVNLKNQQQRCAIHYAAESGNDKIVYLLSVNGADLDTIDQNGNTPLHLCVKNRHTSTALQLMHHGADINLKDGDGSTPLHISVIQNQTDMTQVILKQKALTDIFDFQGKKPEDYANNAMSHFFKNRFDDKEKNEIVTAAKETNTSIPVFENVCLLEMQERKLITGQYIYVPSIEGKKALQYVKEQLKPRHLETLQFFAYTACTQEWEAPIKTNIGLLQFTCLYIVGMLRIDCTKQLERQCHDLNCVLSEIKAENPSVSCSVKDVKIQLKQKRTLNQNSVHDLSGCEEANDTLFRKIQLYLKTNASKYDTDYEIDKTEDKPGIPEKLLNTFPQSPINLEGVYGNDWAPLHISILLGIDEITLMLLKNGVDINTKTTGILPTSSAQECQCTKLAKCISPLLLATLFERHHTAQLLAMGNIDEEILNVCVKYSFGEEMERTILTGICRKLEWKYSNFSLKAYPGYIQDKPFDRNLLGLSSKVFKTKEETFLNQNVLIRNPSYVDENDAEYQAQTQYPLEHEQEELIKKALLFHATRLWENHALLNVITGAVFKKPDLQPCVNIVMYTTIKNFIPIHERSFPKTLKIDESTVDVIVLEGNFVLGPKRNRSAEPYNEFDEELFMGSPIGKKGGSSGTVGPMIDLGKDKLGFLTCAHVFFLDEIKQLKQLDYKQSTRNEEVNRYIAVNPTDSDMEIIRKRKIRKQRKELTTSRSDLDDSSRECGKVIQGLFKTDGDVGMDVALVEITRKDRTPKDGSFIIIPDSELRKYGFKDDPHFNTGKIRNVQPSEKGVQVFKFGAATELTDGRVIFSSLQAKALPKSELSLYCCQKYEVNLDCEHSPPKYLLKGQMNIQSDKNAPFFGAGDSGSGVFARDDEEKNELNCVGIAIGYVNAERTLTVVTPIQPVLNALGDIKLKEFREDSQLNAPTHDPQETLLTKQFNNLSF